MYLLVCNSMPSHSNFRLKHVFTNWMDGGKREREDGQRVRKVLDSDQVICSQNLTPNYRHAPVDIYSSRSSTLLVWIVGVVNLSDGGSNGLTIYQCPEGRNGWNEKTGMLKAVQQNRWKIHRKIVQIAYFELNEAFFWFFIFLVTILVAYSLLLWEIWMDHPLADLIHFDRTNYMDGLPVGADIYHSCLLWVSSIRYSTLTHSHIYKWLAIAHTRWIFDRTLYHYMMCAVYLSAHCRRHAI